MCADIHIVVDEPPPLLPSNPRRLVGPHQGAAPREIEPAGDADPREPGFMARALHRCAVAGSCLKSRSLYAFVLNALSSIPPQQRRDTVVVDVPAGGGVLSFPLAAAGFDVRPLDLFDEYFRRAAARHAGRHVDQVFAEQTGTALPRWLHRRLFGHGKSVTIPSTLCCRRADMEDVLPLPDASVDVLVCVEGIEHVADRHKVLAEFRRVLKPDGRLILTTPNLLAARARIAYALTGQRALKSYVDEYTSVWDVSPDGKRVYHGHAFLVNYFQLRYNLHHTCFRIHRLWPGNWSPSSLLLLPLLWPLVWLFTMKTQRRAKRKYARQGHAGHGPYREMLRHVLSAELMLNATMIIEARCMSAARTANDRCDEPCEYEEECAEVVVRRSTERRPSVGTPRR